MNWILALTLYSNIDGHYIQTFTSKTECVKQMDIFMEKNKDNKDVNSISCVPESILLAEND